MGDILQYWHKKMNVDLQKTIAGSTGQPLVEDTLKVKLLYIMKKILIHDQNQYK